MLSIHDYKKSKAKKYYGASRRVYRQSDLEKILKMFLCLKSLEKYSTLTMLVPSNEEFLNKKAIPSYNDCVDRMKELYPEILEFSYYKKIIKKGALLTFNFANQK